jgi:hypothetical protein
MDDDLGRYGFSCGAGVPPARIDMDFPSAETMQAGRLHHKSLAHP